MLIMSINNMIMIVMIMIITNMILTVMTRWGPGVSREGLEAAQLLMMLIVSITNMIMTVMIMIMIKIITYMTNILVQMGPRGEQRGFGGSS